MQKAQTAWIWKVVLFSWLAKVAKTFLFAFGLRCFLESKELLLCKISGMKQNWKPGTMVYPVPAVMVSCGTGTQDANIITVAWTGTVCSEPPMCYISVRPERHSYEIIRQSGEFVINLTTEHLAKATDWCGVRSGRNFDKFSECGLTPVAGVKVKAPSIGEAPVAIECKVERIIPLGSHDMFLAKVENVIIDDRYLDPDSGKFDLRRAGLMCYSHGEYFALGKLLGTFGWSVKGKSKSKELKKRR